MALIVAASMVMLLVAGAVVLDFGLVRLDRQQNKSAADNAVMAGLRAADGGSTDVFTFRGVCAALSFLKANEPSLNGLPSSFCASPNTIATCDPANPNNPATKASYDQPVVKDGVTYSVQIKSPYLVSDGSFPEEGYASLSTDTSQMNGCDQLAVIITQRTKPGLGSLATNSDLVTRVRSVGRVAVGPGEQAPALVLLDRTHCRVVEIGAAGGGAESKIHVFGAAAYVASRMDGSSGMVQQSGSIHADTNESECSGGGNPAPPVFLGKATNGIVAYASPDLSIPGVITSVAGQSGAGPPTIMDSLSNVYASTSATEGGSGSQLAPTGRALVSRKPVDTRYLSGVRNAVSAAQSSVFSSTTGVTRANAISRGYKPVDNCNPASTDLSGILATDKVYVNCTTGPGVFKGTAPIIAKEVIFNSPINPAGIFSMPNAQKVYLFGASGDALSLGVGTGLSMHNFGAGTCSNANTPNKAILFVKDGGIKATGGLLQLCNTSVIMLGGQPNGCLPAVYTALAPKPTVIPCAGTNGTGQITITGSARQDWTAPNQYDDMSVLTEPQKQAAWNDPNGLEDLALWSESGGPNYSMAGGGTMLLTGIFMVPNAAPFVVKGNGVQSLKNAQYIATSFQVTGGATLNMTVDPNNAVTLPQLNPFTLVR